MSITLSRPVAALALLCSATLLLAETPTQVLLPDAPALVLADVGYALKLPVSDAVPYQGMVDKDAGAGQAGAMLYPAFGLIGALAAVATHGIIVEASKNSERSRLQASADKVLTPYSDAIAGFSQRAMMQQALDGLSGAGTRKVLAATEPAESGWVIETATRFSLNTDVTAMVLDAPVLVYAADQPTEPRYRNMVHVVSDPRPVVPAGEAAAEARNLRLKQDSIALMAHAMQALLADLASERRPGQPASSDRTVRYQEGSVLRSERGQVLSEHCGRVVLRNLRGWLMSVPQRQSPGSTVDPSCGVPAAVPTAAPAATPLESTVANIDKPA